MTTWMPVLIGIALVVAGGIVTAREGNRWVRRAGADRVARPTGSTLLVVAGWALAMAGVILIVWAAQRGLTD